MTKDEEEILIQNFKKEYPKFPDGTLSKQKPPYTDYLLITPTGETIGIELTEIFIDNKLKQGSSEKEHFTEKVLNKLVNVLPFTFSINIELSKNFFLQKSKKETVCEDVVSICVKEFKNLKNYEHKEITNIEIDMSNLDARVKDHLLTDGYRNLPPSIESISLHRYDSVSKSWNVQSEGGVVPRLTLNQLSPTLKKKEKKLQKYTACNQFWLIIKEGNYYSGTFDELDIQIPIQTPFDKVFLFRSKNNQVIDLT